MDPFFEQKQAEFDLAHQEYERLVDTSEAAHKAYLASGEVGDWARSVELTNRLLAARERRDELHECIKTAQSELEESPEEASPEEYAQMSMFFSPHLFTFNRYSMLVYFGAAVLFGTAFTLVSLFKG